MTVDEVIKGMKAHVVDRLAKIIALIPKEEESLLATLKDNQSSLAFAAPELDGFWAEEISNNLSEQIPESMPEEWQQKVYDVWMSSPGEG